MKSERTTAKHQSESKKPNPNVCRHTHLFENKRLQAAINKHGISGESKSGVDVCVCVDVCVYATGVWGRLVHGVRVRVVVMGMHVFVSVCVCEYKCLCVCVCAF